MTLKLIKKLLQFSRYLNDKYRTTSWGITLYQGNLLATEQNLSLLYYGDTKFSGFIKSIFFPLSCQETELSRTRPFARGASKFIYPNLDIIIEEIPPWHKTTDLLLPPYIEGLVLLPPRGAEQSEIVKGLSGSQRNKINKMLKAGFEIELVNSMDDYLFFLDNLLIPMVETRHKENAFCPTLQEISAMRHRESLLFVKEKGERLAGAQLIWPRFKGGESRFTRIGFAKQVLGDRKSYSVFNTALYYFGLVESRKRGCKTMNLGVTFPVANNGVLLHKAQWGANFVLPPMLTRWSAKFLSDKRDCILRNIPLIFLKDGQLCFPKQEILASEPKTSTSGQAAS